MEVSPTRNIDVNNLLNQIHTDQDNETANNEKNKENLVAYPDGA